MIRVKGHYRDQKLELDRPIDLADGTEVIVDIHPAGNADEEDDAFRRLGMERLAEELDNPDDAIYDDWKKLYGV